MTTKTSATQRKTLAAGGQDSLRSGLITCTLTGKNCAVPSLHLDAFSAKEPGFESALASGNAYYHNRRAVIVNFLQMRKFSKPFKITVYDHWDNFQVNNNTLVYYRIICLIICCYPEFSVYHWHKNEKWRKKYNTTLITTFISESQLF